MLNKGKDTRELSFNILLFVFGFILASTTLIYGFEFLTIAGNSSLARGLGALYALVIADLFFWIGKSKMMDSEMTPRQRTYVNIMTGLGFVVSLIFSLTILAINSRLGELLSNSLIETIEQLTGILVLIVTAVYGWSIWRYSVNSPNNKLQTELAESKADIIEASISQAVLLMQKDKPVLVNIISDGMRQSMLDSLGFSGNLEQIASDEKTPPNDNNVIEGQTTSQKDKDSAQSKSGVVKHRPKVNGSAPK